jgi:DNA repair exonuclease SbcCD nuclease subunit
MNELTIFAIGDVHLGMRPGSLPEGLDREGIDPRTLTPEAALLAAVDRAIELHVDVVVFAGDVVESTNARFEALRPLEKAVRQLLAAEIPVLAVAGNHDVEALPRLARMIEGFELIGEGGRWQSRVVVNANGVGVELLGWSFPERQVRASPIDQLLRSPDAVVRDANRDAQGQQVFPRIGLLHADLDASGGHYAPITSRELNESGLDAWLLGHIHQPSLPEGRADSGGTISGYLGSLVGLDPSELGPRGPWLIRVAADGAIVTEHLPISPVRWERFDVQVDEEEGADDLGDRLLAEIVRIGRSIETSGAAPKVLGLRPVLKGPTRHYDALCRGVQEGRWNGLMRSSGQMLVFIDKVIDRLELAHDLDELALGDDPAALMAAQLCTLRMPSDARDTLLCEARNALGGLARDPRWLPLEQVRDAQDPLADDAVLAALLTRSGTETLNALLAQREAKVVAGVSGS